MELQVEHDPLGNNKTVSIEESKEDITPIRKVS